MELHFATSNKGKVEDVQAILSDLDVEVHQLNVEMVEPQEASLDEIVRYKLKQAVENSQLMGVHIMADDSGLFVDALDGFPGILSSAFDSHVGKEKLLRLIDEDDEPTATFRAAIAVFDPDTQDVHTFSGEVKGVLVEPRGDSGFGYDPVFQPDGHDKTFAEDMEHKHRVSHRKQALDKLRAWIANR